ncbi:MAG: hypothetical protein ACRDV4_08810 [Acidimicrobiales bacterium]
MRQLATFLRRYLLRRAIVVTLAVVVSVGSVGGIAYALSSDSPTVPAGSSIAAGTTPSTTTPTGSSAKPGAAARRQQLARLVKLLRHAVRVQIVVPATNGGFRTVDIDKGTVTALSSTSITVAPLDGSSPVSATITSSTHEPKNTTISQGESVYLLSSDGNALIIRPAKTKSSST